MFIKSAVFEFTLGCDCNDCDQHILIILNDSESVFPRAHESDVLSIAKSRGWTVNEGMAFCSDACEEKSRNPILSGDRAVYYQRKIEAKAR